MPLIKLSSLVHVLVDERREALALYHSLKISPIYLDIAAVGFIQGLSGSINSSSLDSSERAIVQLLEKHGFLSNGSDGSLSEIDEKGRLLESSLTTMYLILTEHCNLGCKYCFVEGNFPHGYVRSAMSWEVAKRSIDLLIAQRNRHAECEVWFYGGEPLLEAELLFKCLDYLQQNDSAIDKILITNGTMINEEMANRLTKYDINISVSLDGPESVHDSMRVKRDGTGSYEQVISGIDCMKRAGCDFGVSCTIGEEAASRVVDIAQWINEAIRPNSLGMNLLIDTAELTVTEKYIEQATKGLIDYFEISREEGISEGRIMRKVKAFINRALYTKDCAACGHQIVVSPEGRIGICHEGLGAKDFFIGSVFEEFHFRSDSAISDWARRSPLSMPECYSCFALGICGGGCPYSAMVRHGSIWDVDKRF